MAALHRAAFPDAAWDAAAFAGLVAMPGAVALSADDGFLLGRIVAGEAEILTLAVHPRARRRGIATGLLARFEAAASRAGGSVTPRQASHKMSRSMPRMRHPGSVLKLM
jgi:ribosomal-protein-alanine N-acetyltransferase